MPDRLPRYPVYVPSKGRHEWPHTIRSLEEWGVPHRVVVEPREEAAYRAVVGDHASVLVLPANDVGLIGARNWIKDHAVAEGHARHWQLDDNIRGFIRLYRSKRIPCDAAVALRVCEDFTDRYERVGISGLNYDTFVVTSSRNKNPPPFAVNVHVYSCTLVNNEIPHRWRLRYNDDTDICLQVLADGWNTILLNAFSCRKIRTMTVKGGNTDDLYQGDGRLVMARTLERMWPGVVTVDRRFQRPQHVIDWKRFRQPLVRREGVAVGEGVDEYGMRLEQVRDVRSDHLRAWLEKEKPAP